MEVKSIYENLIFTTVRIETVLNNGTISTGTGFVFEYSNNTKQYLFIVSNKHVIKDAIIGKLEFNKAINGEPDLGNKHTLIITDFEKRWIGHSNPDIDIAITPFAPILKDLMSNNINIYFRSIPETLIPHKSIINDIDAVEDVIIIGYPNGIYDKKNLLPIVRKGITATPANIDFEGLPTFIIDASIFPGSSGSPVFICNIGSFTKKGTNDLYAGSRLMFMGIVASVFIKQDVNTIEVVKIPTKDIPIVKTNQMIDLGIVFKSSCIFEIVEDLLKQHNEL
ncbi:hypothetical protein A9168_09575 [Macellibacteroides sp. HH-ZS]|nr:hypothetical protein A9168_09575 [Macellibacteroides sp. HH-ZS]